VSRHGRSTDEFLHSVVNLGSEECVGEDCEMVLASTQITTSEVGGSGDFANELAKSQVLRIARIAPRVSSRRF
jgi:hypothetical protein